MKKNWTCSAGALELTLASFLIRQFMRLIVHFYSELTLNHHRVFVITSFCDHIHFGRPRYIIKVAPKNRNPQLCHFSRDCIFKIAHLWGEKPRPVRCTLFTYEYNISRALSLSLSSLSLSLSPRSLHFRLAGRLIITQSKITNIT